VIKAMTPGYLIIICAMRSIFGIAG
jgi:hypothetical protein